MMRTMLYEAAQAMMLPRNGLGSRLGDADRQTPRDEKAIVGWPPIGCDHAPHLGRWHRVSVGPETSCGSSMTTMKYQTQ